jgi:hypothetical protein
MRLAVAAVLLAGCPTPRQPPAIRTLEAQRTTASLVGEWRWIHLTETRGTRRVEDERWQFVPRGPGEVVGRYHREVIVQSTDGRPFDCNQMTTYTQRAQFEVVVVPGAAGTIVRETGYKTEPSPCDHGFRKLGEYVATVGEQQTTLSWPAGTATLLRIGPPPAALAEPAWAGANPTALGDWRWSAAWTEPRGSRRIATEAWELGLGPDETIAGTVVRTIETIDPEGAPFACAGSDRWTQTERVAVEARREGEVWRLREVAVEASPHPCRQSSPGRVLDEAIAEQIGDHLVLEWRGDRKQVLSRQVEDHQAEM